MKMPGTANIYVDLHRLGENLDLMLAGDNIRSTTPVVGQEN